jgi:hypothetical protein
MVVTSVLESIEGVLIGIDEDGKWTPVDALEDLTPIELEVHSPLGGRAEWVVNAHNDKIREANKLLEFKRHNKILEVKRANRILDHALEQACSQCEISAQLLWKAGWFKGTVPKYNSIEISMQPSGFLVSMDYVVAPTSPAPTSPLPLWKKNLGFSIAHKSKEEQSCPQICRRRDAIGRSKVTTDYEKKISGGSKADYEKALSASHDCTSWTEFDGGRHGHAAPMRPLLMEVPLDGQDGEELPTKKPKLELSEADVNFTKAEDPHFEAMTFDYRNPFDPDAWVQSRLEHAGIGT